MVRQMYEKYPYPYKPFGVVADIHPQLMLSYLDRPRCEHPEVLDAGCGTGSASLGTAMCNPRGHITAIDLNRTALEQVQAEATQMGLLNLTVQEVDLMTLEGLKAPPGGFDFILSSGVLHHLADPQEGLRRLTAVLSDRGVMRLMVYGHWGRQGLYRFVQALDILRPDRSQLEDRLAVGRALMASLTGGPAVETPWEGAAGIDDSEFVDRYLHLNDRAYTVEQFFQLLEGSGLQFLRWYEPRHWESDDPLLRALAPLDRYRVVELLSHRTQLDALVCKASARKRPPLPWRERSHLSLSPQAVLRSSRRVSGTFTYTYGTTVAVRDFGERTLTPDENNLVSMFTHEPAETARVTEVVAPPDELVERLLQEEVLYQP